MTINISIIIPILNKMQLTRQCINSVLNNTTDVNYEIILVNNGSNKSTEKSLKCICERNKYIKLISNKVNRGFSRACNQGAEMAKGDFIVFLNNDTLVTKNWLQPLLRVFDDNSVACVSGKLLYPNNTIQHAGVVLCKDMRIKDSNPTFSHIYHRQNKNLPESKIRRAYSLLSAASLLVDKRKFNRVKGFCEQYWNGYEDFDLCMKFGKVGYKCVYEPNSIIYHMESQSGTERFLNDQTNRILFWKKWGKVIPIDYIRFKDGAFQLNREAGSTFGYPGTDKYLLENHLMRESLCSLNMNLGHQLKKENKSISRNYFEAAIAILRNYRNKTFNQKLRMVLIYKELGKNSSANRILKRLESEINNKISIKYPFELFYYLSEIYQKKDPIQCRYYLTKAQNYLLSKQKIEPVDWYRIGSIYKTNKQYHLAQKTFKSLLRKKCHDGIRSGIWYHLAEINLSDENRSMAKIYLKKCLENNKDHRLAKVMLTQLI